jgi:hypothetical protein
MSLQHYGRGVFAAGRSGLSDQDISNRVFFGGKAFFFCPAQKILRERGFIPASVGDPADPVKVLKQGFLQQFFNLVHNCSR